MVSSLGDRVDHLTLLRRAEQRLKLDDILREPFRRLIVAPQRLPGALVGTRRPAQSQIDAAGEQRRQGPELLGDHQGRMVRQHDAAGADPDRRGAAGDVADAHRGGGAGDAGQIMMFGQPEARVTGGLGMLRQIPRIAQRVGRGEAFADIGEVENGEFYHGASLAHAGGRDRGW